MHKSSKPIRIFCYDPGITEAGWALLEYNKKGMMTVLKFGTIESNRFGHKGLDKEIVKSFPKRIIALTYLRKRTRELITAFKPDYVVTEAAFYQPGRVTAFIALLQFISVIEMLLYREFNLTLFKVPTKTAKRSICGSGSGGKKEVRKAIFESEFIRFKNEKKVDQLTDHSTDAIAVGWHFATAIYPNMV